MNYSLSDVNAGSDPAQQDRRQVVPGSHRESITKEIGSYFLVSLLVKDFQVVQTLTLYIGFAVVMLNLAVDISYAWLDPRIRYS